MASTFLDDGNVNKFKSHQGACVADFGFFNFNTET